MLKKMLFVAPLVLAACDMPQSQEWQPSPMVWELLEACDEGNLEACALAENARQAELQRRASIPPPVFQPVYQNPADFQTSRAPQQTVCRNSFGQVICTSY